MSEGQVENRTAKNEPYFANINGYAVNGAVHYANALLHHTNYSDIISIGVTGYKDVRGDIHYEIGVYFVSKSNLGLGQKVGDYTDLSFLKKENFDDFIERVKELELTQEELDKVGSNNSMEHEDFMFGSADMSIIGVTQDDKEVVVFKDGNFAF